MQIHAATMTPSYASLKPPQVNRCEAKQQAARAVPPSSMKHSPAVAQEARQRGSLSARRAGANEHGRAEELKTKQRPHVESYRVTESTSTNLRTRPGSAQDLLSSHRIIKS